MLDGNLSNDSLTDFISEQVVDDNNIELTDNDVFIDGKFYTPKVEIELARNPEGNPQCSVFYITAISYARLLGCIQFLE